MKAVYFICNNHDWGHVSWRVWDILNREGIIQEPAGFSFAGQNVMKCALGEHEFFFVPTDIALCLDYPRFLPEMNQYFADADMSGMITWHDAVCSAGFMPSIWLLLISSNRSEPSRVALSR